MKIDPNQIHNILENSSSMQSNSAKNLPDNDADASLQIDYADFIDQAIQPPQTDTNAVQKAEELLSSGQLESPENIKTAAENIITFGI